MAEFLTTTRVAELLGYTCQHVTRLARQGVLRGRKFGRDWLIDSESVDRFLVDRQSVVLPLNSEAESRGN